MDMLFSLCCCSQGQTLCKKCHNKASHWVARPWCAALRHAELIIRRENEMMWAVGVSLWWTSWWETAVSRQRGRLDVVLIYQLRRSKIGQIKVLNQNHYDKTPVQIISDSYQNDFHKTRFLFSLQVIFDMKSEYWHFLLSRFSTDVNVEMR